LFARIAKFFEIAEIVILVKRRWPAQRRRRQRPSPAIRTMISANPLALMNIDTFLQNTPISIDSRPGTYALVFACADSVRLAVGRLGPVSLTCGYYIYVGSAFGPGGLRARLNHHLKPSLHPHWHLDYIKCALCLVEIWITTDPVKREHDWAGIIAAMKGASLPIAGFGATDCGCRSHLIHFPHHPGFSGFRNALGATIAQHSKIGIVAGAFQSPEHL
jgi:Uri superfamily endonuclease